MTKVKNQTIQKFLKLWEAEDVHLNVVSVLVIPLMIEMLEDAPQIDTLLIPVGGGGLLSGCSIVAKNLKKNINIIAVQSENFPSFYNSFYKKNV